MEKNFNPIETAKLIIASYEVFNAAAIEDFARQVYMGKNCNPKDYYTIRNNGEVCHIWRDHYDIIIDKHDDLRIYVLLTEPMYDDYSFMIASRENCIIISYMIKELNLQQSQLKKIGHKLGGPPVSHPYS